VWDLSVQDRELVSENEDLGVFCTIASAPQHEQVDDQPSEAIRNSKHGQNPRGSQPRLTDHNNAVTSSDAFPAPTPSQARCPALDVLPRW
jgi:hypothetical protein